jgi:protein TonB
METQEVYQAVQLAIEEEDIPITQMMNTPPPCHRHRQHPSVGSGRREDDAEIEEVLIETTETTEEEVRLLR